MHEYSLIYHELPLYNYVLKLLKTNIRAQRINVIKKSALKMRLAVLELQLTTSISTQFEKKNTKYKHEFEWNTNGNKSICIAVTLKEKYFFYRLSAQLSAT